MAIIDIFRKKKGEKELKKAKEIKTGKPQEGIKEQKIADIKEKKAGQAWGVLRAPQIAEKATELAKQNQYTFKIWPKSNKLEVKKAVENLYGVNVLDVKIIRVPRKQRRLGRISGYRAGYKKAIIKIKEGQKIEVLPR